MEKLGPFEVNSIACGDCLEIMPQLPDKYFDMILCDLPYGTTACKWDTIIPFEPLWKQYKRIIKDNGAVVLTARETFTSLLVVSNINNYKHKWVWNKKQSGSFQNAKFMPLQIEEDILVFANGRVNYYPQMRRGEARSRGGARKGSGATRGLNPSPKSYGDMYFPVNIIELANPRRNKLHPTQKPVALFEYLIRTYTNEGGLVLDNCIGSGTTAIAAMKSNRNFFGCDSSEEYVEIALNRIERYREKYGLSLF